MPHNFTLDTLHSAYKGENSGRKPGDVSIHASSLVSFCARKYAICIKNDIPVYKSDYIGKGLALTFELGHKIQSIVVNRFKKTGNLIGTWQCLSCKKKYFGLKEKICPNCNKGTHILYTDTTLVLEDYGVPIVGNIDIMLLRTAKEILAVEAKSINKAGFDAMAIAPLRDHYKQVNIYLWLLRRGAKIRHSNGFDFSKIKVNTKVGTVLYVSKAHNISPFKSCKVTEDREYIASIESKMEEIKYFHETGKMLKPICDSKGCMMARDCHVRDKCFEKRKSK